MGQKFAEFDGNGNITAFYDSVDSPVPSGVSNVIEITEGQWQTAISTPGCTVANGALVVPPPPTSAQFLAQAQEQQTDKVSAACATALVAGFTSSALGSARTYGSNDNDQRNLLSAAMASQGNPETWTTPLWCADGDAWAFLAHTATQVQKVNADWQSFLVGAQQKCAELIAKIDKAKTVAAVQAVTWVNP
ncbi:hypothetical protein [Cupriavidus metallidurans]|uniref:DUF4376 domain-containing protein n=1 Tax=Cupriavidus metallidurans TaxID=119219 RepID=UPI000CE05119|nr:hypothetical protein [Cupriavidus metallidurans]AVA33027.1 hypothetical protein C3Z06_04915 [Cupriavidus metallidurans]